MKKTTYIWAWKDDDGVFVNADTSFEAIIKNIIEHYKGESVDEISIVNDGKTIAVSFYDEDDSEQKQYTVKATPWDVAEFLKEYAEECGKEDWFDIKELVAKSK